LHALTTLNNQKKRTAVEANDSSQTSETDNTKQDKHHYFDQHCARLRHIAKPGSLVYLITDGHALRDEKNCPHALRHLSQISQISQHCELVLCLINDPLEQALPESSLKLAVTFTDGINRQQLTLGDSNTAEQYQQQAFAQNEKMQLLLQSTGARVIHFSAGESLEQQLKYGASL
jgi:hypothetical protein